MQRRKENHIKRTQVKKIQQAVAEYFNMPVTFLRSQKRPQEYYRQRSVAIGLSTALTRWHPRRIGQMFGNRSIKSVNKHCKRLESLRKTDHEIDEAVNKLMDFFMVGQHWEKPPIKETRFYETNLTVTKDNTESEMIH